MDPSLYCALRFSIAGIVMFPNALGRLKNTDLAIRSSFIGMSVFFGYIGQTVGMQAGSTADKSAFICSLNVVWVALYTSVVSKSYRKEKHVSKPWFNYGEDITSTDLVKHNNKKKAFDFTQLDNSLTRPNR